MNELKFLENAYAIEKIIAKIFEKSGYTVSLPSVYRGHEYDISAEKNHKKLAIEMKSSRSLVVSSRVILRSVDRLLSAAKRENKVPVLVIANLLSDGLREELLQYSNLIVVDIQNLLFMVQSDEELRNELVSVLNFSVDKLKPFPPDLDITWNEANTDSFNADSYIEKLRLWQAEDTSSKEYEKICCQILKTIFADDLSLWSEQQKSNDKLFRFDLICKIKDGNGKEFWGMAERYFSSKYIVFEFKNYSDKVTQKEVFTTEKYLYLKALRGIAILISVKGTDSHADKVIRGILREEGKLIISLSNEDLINMLLQKKNNEEPADYLSNKLDELLIDLEK